MSQLTDIKALAVTSDWSVSADFESLVREFDTIDPRSMTFRYATDKTGGAPTLGRDFAFDFAHFVSSAEVIVGELEELEAALASRAADELLRDLDLHRGSASRNDLE